MPPPVAVGMIPKLPCLVDDVEDDDDEDEDEDEEDDDGNEAIRERTRSNKVAPRGPADT